MEGLRVILLFTQLERYVLVVCVNAVSCVCVVAEHLFPP